MKRNPRVQAIAGTLQPLWILALFLGATACKGAAFRGVNSKTATEEPQTSAPGAGGPLTPGGVRTAATDGASETAPTTPDEIAPVQSAKVVKETSTRDAFLEALLRAAISSSVASTSSTSPESSGDSPLSPVAPGGSSEGPGSTVTRACTAGSAAAPERLADVVFSIDVSTSMGPYIQTVKENVMEFSDALSRQGIQARFAAVGFVNEPLQSIDFSDGATFRSTLSGWRVLDAGNYDMQEGGQSALEHALWMLSAPEVGARPQAAKVIVHISDALAFAGKDHSNFSVTQLAQLFRAANSQFGSLLFFDSVPTTPGETGGPANKKQTSFSARTQMTDLRSQAQTLGGMSLSFPFVDSAMTLDLPQSIQSGLSGLPNCP